MAKTDAAGQRGRIGGMIARELPASAGKLGKREACYVAVNYSEDGEMRVDVTAVGSHREGGRISATISGDEIPFKLREALERALDNILEDAHDDLKLELEREAHEEAVREATAGAAGGGSK